MNFRKAPYNFVKMHFRAIPLPKVHYPIQYLQLHVKGLLLSPCPFLPQPCKVLKQKYLLLITYYLLEASSTCKNYMSSWPRGQGNGLKTKIFFFWPEQRFESWPRRNPFSFNFCLFLMIFWLHILATAWLSRSKDIQVPS